jgi:hypothetical protein
MLRYSSALDSDRATTDITLTGTIIRTGITTGRTMATPTTDLIIGTVATVTTVTNVIIATIIGTNLKE